MKKSSSKPACLMRRASLAAVSLAFAAWVPSAAAAPIEIKFGHVGAPGSLFQTVADEFAKRANAKLGDKAKVVVYGSSQLGGDKEMLQKLRLGTLDMSLPSTVMSSEAGEFGLFEMPYLVKDRGHMAKIEKEIVWPKLAPAAKAKGLELISVWENGYRNLTNNVRPINKPEDLAGIKLRTPKGTWRVRMFKAYGANPTPMKFSELFTALQTGVMDGQENPLTQIYSSKLYEVQKYLSMSGHVYSPAYLVAGSKKWASLPADVRSTLQAAAREAQAFCYQTAEKMDVELLSKLKSSGIKVNTVDKAAFIKASGPIYETFGKEVKGGKEMVERAIALAK